MLFARGGIGSIGTLAVPVLLVVLATVVAAQTGARDPVGQPDAAVESAPESPEPSGASGGGKAAVETAVTLSALSEALALPTGLHRIQGVRVTSVASIFVRKGQLAFAINLEEPATGSRLRSWPFGGDFGVLILSRKLGVEALHLYKNNVERLAAIEIEVMVSPFRTGTTYLGVVRRIEWFDDKGHPVGLAFAE